MFFVLVYIHVGCIVKLIVTKSKFNAKLVDRGIDLYLCENCSKYAESICYSCQNPPESISQQLVYEKFIGGMPPDPPNASHAIPPLHTLVG